MNFRSVSCLDCGKRITPRFEGGLQGFLTLDLGGRDIWNRGLDRCLGGYERVCVVKGVRVMCVGIWGSQRSWIELKGPGTFDNGEND